MKKLIYFGTLLATVAAHGEGKAATNDAAAIPWSQIGAKAGADYIGDGLAVTPTELGARLHCVFQRLDGEATPQGLGLTSTVTNTINDRFRVTAVEIGRKSANAVFDSQGPDFNLQLAAAGTVSVKAQTVRFSRPGLTEEYSVSMDGVRQDFIVEQAPPSRAAGELFVKLAVTGAKVAAAAYGARLVLENSGRKIAYSRLRVTDATGSQLSARIEMVPNTGKSPFALAVIVKDTDAVYPVRIDPTFGDANWISMGVIPGTDGAVFASVVDSAGNLYIGGGFTVAGGINVANIARWDGNTWSDIGGGVDGQVNALAVLGDTIYAAGSFSFAGGVSASNIAQWKGSQWAPLGSGIDGEVNALAVSGTNLYAGGAFVHAGDKVTFCVAMWDGASWSALGEGVAQQSGYQVVYALTCSGTNLYVGGGFDHGINGTYPLVTAVWATNIAQWNGYSWSALGSGVGGQDTNGFVSALATSGRTLYVGGSFTSAGGIPATNMA